MIHPAGGQWYEIEWDIEGGAEGPEMQISKIQNTEGEGKQVMSKFPMKGHKANWFMVASGVKSTATFHVKVYQKKNIV